MSTDNIRTFLDKASTDSALQAQVAEAYRAAQQATADALANLSAEAGTPFTAEEFLASQAEISEQDLADVAGGAGVGNFVHGGPRRPAYRQSSEE